MTRDELAEKIRHLIRDTSMWGSIEHGKTQGQCKKMSREIYGLLNEPEHQIPGLSVAVVTNYLGFTDHAWLIAHHPDPDIGYFMIDPTIGQFVKKADTGKPYNDVYIGSYNELEKMLLSGEYKLQGTNSQYKAWSPALRFHVEFPDLEKPHVPRIYYKPDEIKLWNKYEFHISTDTKRDQEKMEPGELYGKWAARMEEAGLNWQSIMTLDFHRTVWPDPESAKEVEYFNSIIEARNRHIQLGTDSKGFSYQDMLKEYKVKDTPRAL